MSDPMSIDETEQPSSRPNIPHPLSSIQEKRLVDYLDERLLDIARNFKKRSEKMPAESRFVITLDMSEPSSSLRTLSAYMDGVRTILALILQIPPLDPSTGLRIAYMLRITGDVLSSIPGYKLGAANIPVHTTLQVLLDFLDDLDQAWVAVLQGQVWDPVSAEGVDLVLPISYPQSNEKNGSDSYSHSIRPPRSSPPSQTDIARLRSLLFAGESTLEEWLTERKSNGGTSENDGTEDVSAMLARMGLLDQFDTLFARTLDYLGGFSGNVGRNVVDPGPETMME